MGAEYIAIDSILAHDIVHLVMMLRGVLVTLLLGQGDVDGGVSIQS